MFINASAIVAILTREPEAHALADVLESAQSPITSPIAIFEAALGLCRKRHASVEEAEQDVGEFLGLAGVRTVSVTDKEAHTALVAFSRYGKGRGHPATTQPGRLLCLCGREDHQTTLHAQRDVVDWTLTEAAVRPISGTLICRLRISASELVTGAPNRRFPPKCRGFAD